MNLFIFKVIFLIVIFKENISLNKDFKMKKTMRVYLAIILLSTIIFSSCSPNACDCVEQLTYANSTDDGFLNVDKNKLKSCVEEYADKSGEISDIFKTAEKNAKEKCNQK